MIIVRLVLQYIQWPGPRRGELRLRTARRKLTYIRRGPADRELVRRGKSFISNVTLELKRMTIVIRYFAK